MDKTRPLPSLTERAAIHAALADPHRLAICDLLALSDRAPSELATILEIGSNLLAHHLSVLVSGGLVRTVVSAGDRRRRYVQLSHDWLDGLASPAIDVPTAILFVCKQNSARSQLALALWRQHSAIPAASAGTDPTTRVHPGAKRVAARHGLDLSDAVPRSIDSIDFAASLLVTVCDEANEAIREWDVERLHWSIPDPATGEGTSAFEEAFLMLSDRVQLLARTAA